MNSTPALQGQNEAQLNIFEKTPTELRKADVEPSDGH